MMEGWEVREGGRKRGRWKREGGVRERASGSD